MIKISKKIKSKLTIARSSNLDFIFNYKLYKLLSINNFALFLVFSLSARSKGLSEFAIVRKHVFRNSFIPIITVLPVAISGVISGSFFIERVFAIPGAGQYFIQAIPDRDVPILMGLTLLYAAIYNIAIFISDILYTVVDPRIRLVK